MQTDESISTNQRRNRRLNYLERILDGSDYLSAASIRKRYPNVFHAIAKHIQVHPNIDIEEEGLVNRICRTIDDNEFLQTVKDSTEEFDESDLEDGDKDKECDGVRQSRATSVTTCDDGRDSAEPAEEEVEQQLSDIIRYAREAFLDGNDPDFDYSNVDLDGAYDDLDLAGRDAEDAYFDSEDT